MADMPLLLYAGSGDADAVPIEVPGEVTSAE